MKHIAVFLLIGLFLLGCQSSTVIDGTAVDGKSEKSIQVSDTDEYFLKICKELYVAKQYKQAYQIASKLAEKNNSEAQYLLGYLFYYGQGVPVDMEQGTKWIEASADSGYRPAIEALVMVRHGLTPDNKCPSVNQIPKITSTSNNAVSDADSVTPTQKTETIKDLALKDGEVLITPASSQKEKTASELPKASSKTESIWDRYTIQLINNSSEVFIKDYMMAFNKQYPELSDFIISYKSKSEPYSYGVGFSTYQTEKEADNTLQKLQSRLKYSSLFVHHLHNYVPLKK